MLTLAKSFSLEDLGKMYGIERKEKNYEPKNFSPKKPQQKNFKSSTSSQKNSTQNNLSATAPYNFVSLPEKILPSPIADVESYKKQIQSSELFSGKIEIEIENLTPLFIGGNGEKNFAPVTEIIPGSSLRGMFKNIFKIVTCGAFRGKTSTQKKGEDFNDEHIYYRCLMKNNQVAWDSGYNWSKDLNKIYNDRMTSLRQGKPVKNARPGFLIQTSDGKFFVVPLAENCFESKVSIKNPIFRNLEKSCILWEDKKAYIFTGKGGKKKNVRFTEISDADWSKNNWLELPDEVRESYEHDRNRKGVNLFKDSGILKSDKIFELAPDAPKEIKTLVPCHFLEKGGKVTAFGHGQCFRIPYKNSIGEIVEKNLQSDIVDFADAVFGKADFWSSRVFFEDAKIISNAETLPTAEPKPLMQPNPTSYQLYLKQDDRNFLNHWDSRNAKIRGYKLYWHDKISDWQDKENYDEKSTKKITPLKTGNRFKSKIRFENLSKIELGALLMIFDLNGAKNPAYKIGMAKSLGLGSIKVTPKLFVENSTAYTELFDSDIFKNPYSEENFTTYLEAFKNYVEECGLKSVWEKIMQELNLILDWDNTQKNNWHEKIKPMLGNVQSGNVDDRFIKRIPLPSIFEVVKC